MENFVSSYVSSHRTHNFKSKGLSYRDIIMGSFNFRYAGVVDCYIDYCRKKYIVVCIGFTYDGQVAFFSKNRHMKFEYDSLYVAVQKFHQVCNIFTNSLDWFNKEYFDSCEFYNYANKEFFK